MSGCRLCPSDPSGISEPGCPLPAADPGLLRADVTKLLHYTRFLPLEPPWAGEAAELGRMTAKLSHGRAERRAERSERAGVGGPRRVRSMPPGLGVLRGPAAPTQPEPRRERPQPARPEGSGWGFSWMPTACASEEDRSLCCSSLRWNKPSSGRSDKNLGVEGFLISKEKLIIVRHAVWLFDGC